MQVERHRDGGRRITQVTDVGGLEGEVVLLNDIAKLEGLREGADGRLAAKYKFSRARPSFHERLQYFGLEQSWAAIFEDAA